MRSASGRIAFALGTVVWMRSSSTSEVTRLRSRARRWLVLRPSFLPAFKCLMSVHCSLFPVPGSLLGVGAGDRIPLVVNPHPQRQAHLRQDLLDLVERLAAEVLRLQHLVLALLDELADGLDIGVLQAVVRAHAQLQLLDRAVEILVAQLVRAPLGVLAA